MKETALPLPDVQSVEPMPIRQVVLKVRGDCNLACPDCYVYNGADLSWADKPMAMDDATLDRAADRIGEHAVVHNLAHMQAILHGGEPLTNGLAYIRRTARVLRQAMPGDTNLKLSMQTNGVLLSRRMLDGLLEENIGVGVSLDGPPEVNNHNRPFRNGRGSHDIVARNLRLLGSEKYRQIFRGILCTVDPASDPIETYDHLAGFAPPELEFLMRHATWDAPPADAPATANWLIRAFDHWSQGPGSASIPVRLFDSLLSLMIGGPSLVEQIGPTPTAVAIIDTNGDYELEDSLKVAYPGAPATGLNVFEHSLDDVTRTPAVLARQLGVKALCATCQTCPLVKVCGGGLQAHRYRSDTGLMNPSVYCDDLKLLIPHVDQALRSGLKML